MIVISSVSLLLDVILGVALIPSLGAEGGALADVVTETVAAIAMTGVVMAVTPQHGVKLSLLPRPILATALAACVLFAPIGAIPRVLALSVVYFTALALTGGVPDELRAAAGVPALARRGHSPRR
jgi:hypothetical protein